MMAAQRAQAFFALGDPLRLELVDQLSHGDLPVKELGRRLGIPGNLLAHHLGVLEEAGVVWRQTSEGDRRRRYVGLERQVFERLAPPGLAASGVILFACNRNSARSQYAAARWLQVTGQAATSAGHQPADEVHPLAVEVAAERGLDLGDARPRGYESITSRPDLLITVCDRANEAPLPEAGRHLHWSIPDPVPLGSIGSFRRAFGALDRRIDSLTDERTRR